MRLARASLPLRLTGRLPQGGVGARKPVTVGQCALACLGAPGCEGFTYNSAQQVPRQQS